MAIRRNSFGVSVTEIANQSEKEQGCESPVASQSRSPDDAVFLSLAPVSLAPVGRLTFPDQQQNSENAAKPAYQARVTRSLNDYRGSG